MTRKWRTYLIYHIYEGLGVVLTVKATDNITLVPAREGGIDQEGECVKIKRASDQSSKSWGVEVETDGPGSSQHLVPNRRRQGGGIPVSDAEVAASCGPTGTKLGARSPTRRFPSRGEFELVIIPVIRWISDL